MITFHNFAIEIKTSWAERVVKPIAETKNGNYSSKYVWLIHSRIKNIKNTMQKRINSKYK